MMKFLFEAEDAVIGIAVGILIIGFSGRYFSVPDIPILWGIVFAICFILTILDLIHTFKEFSMHPALIFLAVMTNIIDAIIETGFVIKFFGLNVPFLSTYVVPYLQGELYLFIVGVFFAVSSAFWLLMLPLYAD